MSKPRKIRLPENVRDGLWSIFNHTLMLIHKVDEIEAPAQLYEYYEYGKIKEYLNRLDNELAKLSDNKRKYQIVKALQTELKELLIHELELEKLNSIYNEKGAIGLQKYVRFMLLNGLYSMGWYLVYY